MSDEVAAAPQERSVGRHTVSLAAGTAVSRALGMVRSMLLAAAIGVTASAAADAYAVANRLPNVMYAILAAGVLNSALVPQIVKAFAEGRERTVHRILTIGGVGILGLTVVLTVTAGFWVRVYSDDWGPERTALATTFALWCIPQLLFYGLYTLWGQVLNAKQQFGPYMWAPVANNVVSIAGLVAFLLLFGPYAVDDAPEAVIIAEWTTPKILLIAAVATLGIAAQALVLIPPLIKGGYRWRWVWRGPKGELTTAAKVTVWTLGAVLVEQLGVLLVTRVNSAAQAAASQDPHVAGVAAWDYALVIVMVPHSLVSISLMTVLFTQMSRRAVDRDLAGLRELMSRGVRMVGVFAVFASVAMIVLAPHVVRVLAPTVPGASVDAVAWVLRCMAFSLAPLGAAVMIKQVYYALEDGRTVFLIHILMTAAWLAVGYGLAAVTGPMWWVRGVAIGMVVTNLVAAVLRLAGLRRKLGGVDARRIGATYAKAALAAAGAALIGWGVVLLAPGSWREDGLAAILESAGVVVVGGLAMTVTYLALAKVLGLDEVGAVAQTVLRKFRRVR